LFPISFLSSVSPISLSWLELLMKKTYTTLAREEKERALLPENLFLPAVIEEEEKTLRIRLTALFAVRANFALLWQCFFF
jgi:hypothetical protein